MKYPNRPESLKPPLKAYKKRPKTPNYSNLFLSRLSFLSGSTTKTFSPPTRHGNKKSITLSNFNEEDFQDSPVDETVIHMRLESLENISVIGDTKKVKFTNKKKGIVVLSVITVVLAVSLVILLLLI